MPEATLKVVAKLAGVAPVPFHGS